jgi:hypothetical protein
MVRGLVDVRYYREVLGQRPQASRQRTGTGHRDHRGMCAACAASSGALPQPALRRPPDVLENGRLLLESPLARATDRGGSAGGPGTCAQRPLGMGMPGCGQRPLLAPLPRGLCGRDQAQAWHACSWGIETGEGPKVRPQRDGHGAGHTAPSLEGLTHGGNRHACTGSGSAWASRWRRSVGAWPAWTSACKTLCGVGGGQSPSESPRRGAGPPFARPVERLACRRTKAVRRNLGAWRALRVSSRARGRSRMAASAPVGPATAGRAPERARRARGRASLRSVVTRSPAFVGMREGATPFCNRFF